ncbi:unnamed protein product, partial [Porites evermanni]
MNSPEGAKRSSQGSAEENKRQRVDEGIIHCSDETGDLVSLKDLESWKMLLNAAVIRNHEGILSIAKIFKEGEIPHISYHRKCRSIFTLKRDLKKLSQSVIQVQQQGDTRTKTREALIQSVDLHVDLPSGEQLWVKTIQGYWLLSLGNLLQQKGATISLVIMITLETFKELLAVVITRKRKMSVLNIPVQNHKPKRTPSEMKDQKVNTGMFKPITR